MGKPTELRASHDSQDGGSERSSVHLSINGDDWAIEVPNNITLADALRTAGFTSVKTGCEHGICGSCTVIVDNQACRSCLMFAVQADGRRIETLEGETADDASLNGLQRALSEHHGLQCGYCTSGFIMLVTAYLRTHEDPSELEILTLLSSNLCRCTGYQGILEAVMSHVGEESTG